MNAIILYIITLIKGSNIIYGIVVIASLLLAFAIFMANTAISEQQQASISFASALLGWFFRIAMIVIIALLTQKLFDSQEIIVMRSWPIPTYKFIIGYYAAFAVIALFMAILITMILAILEPFSYSGLLLYGISFLCELLIITAFSVFFALMLNNSFIAIFAAFSMLIISRSSGFVIGAMERDGYSGVVGVLAEYILLPILMLMPRLDLFSVTNWLIYGLEDGIFTQILMINFVQLIVYVALMLAIIYSDMSKRNSSGNIRSW